MKHYPKSMLNKVPIHRHEYKLESTGTKEWCVHCDVCYDSDLGFVMPQCIERFEEVPDSRLVSFLNWNNLSYNTKDRKFYRPYESGISIREVMKQYNNTQSLF